MAIKKISKTQAHMIKELDVKILGDVQYLRQILHRVKHGDQYIIKEDDQAEAALLPLDDLEFLKKAKARRESAWDDFFDNLREVHALNAGFSAEEVEADVDAAIREIRQSRK